MSDLQEMTRRNAERAELKRLVRTCGERYGFTEAEHTDALRIALADHDAALLCFRAMAAERRAD